MEPFEIIKRPTIKDIAREAGVSPATVSLVLNKGQDSRIGQETQKRVTEIADRLNYRPNRVARYLVTKKSATIGLVGATLLNSFYAQVAESIIVRAREEGYVVIASSVAVVNPCAA